MKCQKLASLIVSSFLLSSTASADILSQRAFTSDEDSPVKQCKAKGLHGDLFCLCCLEHGGQHSHETNGQVIEQTCIGHDTEEFNYCIDFDS